MSVLEKAKGHFSSLKGQKIDVPEWGVTVYFDPPTLKQRADWNEHGEALGQAKVMIACCKDESGDPLFVDNAHTLAELQTEVDPSVTTRIVKRILGTDEKGKAASPGN